MSPHTGMVANAWILSRADGARLGFTDHDGALEVDGVVCAPASGFTPSAVESQLGFGFDNAALQGVLSDERLRADHIAAGLYRSARVAQWRVDWTGKAEPELIRTQILGEITHRSDGHFQAEAVGLSALLERVEGRVVSRLCAARFGDAACGVDLSDHAEGTTCARSFAACKGFGNAVNYQGFPHLIGDDALVQGVNDTLPRDGGSRYGGGPNV